MLYRATIKLASGQTAAVEFDYDEPERGHRNDPDGYVPAFYSIQSIAIDGVPQKRPSAYGLIVLQHHKPELLAAVNAVEGAREWQSWFA